MRIDVSQIAKVKGASADVDFCEVIDGLEDFVNDFRIIGPVHFKGELVNMGGIFKLKGLLTLDYSSKCCRCLKDVDSHMSVDVAENFVSGDKPAEEDVYTFGGNCIVIDKAIIDNIVLNLPVRQVCSDKCKGLCAVCGNDLNVSECNCKIENVNPRLESLKDFFSV